MSGLPENKVPVLRVPVPPIHTNWGGDAFGGWIMSQVDIAGSIPAIVRAKGRVVTRAVKDMVFLKPVLPGDLLSLYAEVIRVGNTSITVYVEVYVQRDPITLEAIRVSEGTVTYVAVDEEGRPRPVPDA
jgi:acyl-CoA thioesterase YciA